MIYEPSTFTEICGQTPQEVFNARVDNFMATLGEAKIVKKNQILRVLELYTVMMIIIIISWIIYSIFRTKESD
jgi:hypothetical protein